MLDCLVVVVMVVVVVVVFVVVAVSVVVVLVVVVVVVVLVIVVVVVVIQKKYFNPSLNSCGIIYFKFSNIWSHIEYNLLPGGIKELIEINKA